MGAKQVQKQDGVLICEFLPFGGEPPIGQQHIAMEHAGLYGGVADIDGEQHGDSDGWVAGLAGSAGSVPTRLERLLEARQGALDGPVFHTIGQAKMARRAKAAPGHGENAPL